MGDERLHLGYHLDVWREATFGISFMWVVRGSIWDIFNVSVVRLQLGYHSSGW